MDEIYSGEPFFDLAIILGTNTNVNYKCQSHVKTIRVPNISITTCSINMNENFICQWYSQISQTSRITMGAIIR